MAENIGYVKGEICNRDGCDGIIDEHILDGGCSCHINPPCGYCTEPKSFCVKCGWDDKEEQAESQQKQTVVPVLQLIQHSFDHEKYYNEDDGKLYDVNKYFDDVFDGKITTGKTLGEARRIKDKYKRNIYTSYKVVLSGKEY